MEDFFSTRAKFCYYNCNIYLLLEDTLSLFTGPLENGIIRESGTTVRVTFHIRAACLISSDLRTFGTNFYEQTKTRRVREKKK